MFFQQQGLIGKVDVEMAKYHLYAVVPQLVRFIEVLTNWYVKANRRRLKGQGNTPADTKTALSVLVTVLFTLCRLMSSLTPFLVEVIYQNLKFILPASVQVRTKSHNKTQIKTTLHDISLILDDFLSRITR